MTDQDRSYRTSAEAVIIGDLEVAYRRQGDGDGLLYLHGSRLTRRWLPLYELLAQRFDVLVPDHPGFGDTPTPVWLSDFTDLSIHYADLLSEFGWDRVHLAGDGFGAWLAAEFASIYPERVNTLTLISPTGLRPEGDAHPADPFRLTESGLLDVLLGDDRELATQLLGAEDFVERKLQEYREATTEALLTWSPRYDLKLDHRLSRLRAPTQILVPEQDRLIAPSVARRYGELIPGAVTSTVAGAGEPRSI